jgi:hypothetical protein
MDPRHLNRRCLVLLAMALLLAAVPASAAVTTVSSVSVSPPSPTTCDSALLHVEGIRPPCAQIVGAEVSGPEPIPEWAGPLPAYRTRVSIRIEQTVPIVCAEVGGPYARDFPMPPLPFGQHFVAAVERIFDQNGNLLDSSVVNTSFAVTQSDSCGVQPCVFLGFSPLRPFAIACDASAMPGGEGCFDVVLGNSVPAGGIQLRIQTTDDQGQPLQAGAFVPRSVTTTARSAPMQVAWEADGSAVGIILFSPTDAVLPPGTGPILHVCYTVGSGVAPGVYRILFEKSLVADSQGRELPHCPTFRETSGRFCVGATQGCDVDGDGSADIRDIIRIVRCALAGDACPDTVEARSDCNGDGAVDVRDVICCARTLLLVLPGGTYPEPPAIRSPFRIGLSGSAWTGPNEGLGRIAFDPGTNFGGVEFDLQGSSGLAVTGLTLEGSGYRLEWASDGGNGARVVLLREGSAAVGPGRLRVDFERRATIALDVSALRIANVRAATWDGAIAPFEVTSPFSHPSETPAAPLAPAIYAARPNPFAGSTEIPFALPSAGRMSLRIYDVAGRLVRTLVDEERPAGESRAAWDGTDDAGRDARTGIYFVKLSAAGMERTSRIMKLR